MSFSTVLTVSATFAFDGRNSQSELIITIVITQSLFSFSSLICRRPEEESFSYFDASNIHRRIINHGNYSTANSRQVFEYVVQTLMHRSYNPSIWRFSVPTLPFYRLLCAVTNNESEDHILCYARRCRDFKIQLENAAELIKVVFTNKFDFDNCFLTYFLLLRQSFDLSDESSDLCQVYEDCTERRRLQLAESDKKKVQLRSSARPKFAVGMVVKWMGSIVRVIVSWRVIAKESASESSTNLVEYDLSLNGEWYYTAEGKINWKSEIPFVAFSN